MTTDVHEQLKRGLAVISDEDKWCKGDNAKNVHNVGRREHDKDAVQWCMVGCIYKANTLESEINGDACDNSFPNAMARVRPCFIELAKVVREIRNDEDYDVTDAPGAYLSDFNDESEYADVVDVFKTAIENTKP